jgi:2-haloalkanoic acid dehalogenase type II
MIQTILFDAYGTLFDEGKESVPKIAAEVVKKLKIEGVNQEELFNEWKENYLYLEQKVLSNSTEFKTIKEINIESLTTTFKKFKITESPLVFVNDLFHLWSKPRLFPEVNRVFHKLDKYTLGILSNTDNGTLRSAIRHTKLKIDYVLTSERAGSYKPAKEIFLQACKDLSQDIDSILYVGNSMADIIGAKQAKFKMVWVNRKRVTILKDLNYRPDYEVKSLTSLPSILMQLNYPTINY